jgi:hypothetical protein
MTTVCILTYCHNVNAIAGNALIFKTLRKGFPNAKVHIVDNNSIPIAREKIKKLAKENDCVFTQQEKTTFHSQFIKEAIYMIDDPIVILDPDICFWENCENWKFEALIAGRYIPEHNCNISAANTLPRLHTSFLSIPEPKKLKEKIVSIYESLPYKNAWDPFQHREFNIKGTWYRHDTLGNLYSTIKDEAYSFSEKELNCYDHVFYGAIPNLTIPWLEKSYKEKVEKWHSYIQENNIEKLKGIWKEQQLFFENSKIKLKNERMVR